MSRTLLTLSLSASLMGGTALADVPNVAADIAPIHSLVARVMEGVSTPDLIVQSGASPHEYSLRPSEAAALQNANLVFWVGPDLTPWLEGAIETIATNAAVTELMEADGTIELPFREGALFEAHSHGDEDHDEHGDEDHDDHEGHDHDEHGEEDHDDHEGHDHDEHGEEDHDDHEGHDHDEHGEEDHDDHEGHDHDEHGEEDHDDHEGHDHDEHGEEDHDDHEGHDHDEHGEEDHDDHEGHDHDEHGEEDHDDHEGHDHDEHAGHDHGAHDPHVWLSPDNAATWLNVIAAQLSAADPDNAGTYFANAASARSEIVTLVEEVNATLDPLRGGRFIVFHDAYQYFETTFDFPASGAISLSDASDPSPKRIAEIQDRIAAEGVDCVLAEPQFNMGLIETVLDGTTANTGVMDPLGSDLELGSGLYPQLIRNLAGTLADCL